MRKLIILLTLLAACQSPTAPVQSQFRPQAPRIHNQPIAPETLP